MATCTSAGQQGLRVELARSWSERSGLARTLVAAIGERLASTRDRDRRAALVSAHLHAVTLEIEARTRAVEDRAARRAS